jgi:hypothetical protein
LTTIRQDFGEMGRRGLKLLLETLEDPDGPPRHLEVEPELIVRSSTAPPPALTSASTTANAGGQWAPMTRSGGGRTARS